MRHKLVSLVACFVCAVTAAHVTSKVGHSYEPQAHFQQVPGQHRNMDNCLVDGSTFIGISLSRIPADFSGNRATVTRQEQLDLCEVIDSDFKYVQDIDDFSWLVCGGQDQSQPGHKIDAVDSSHIEIVHPGNTNDDLGGINYNELVRRLNSVPFPPLKVKPWEVVLNDDHPAKVELRMETVNTSSIYQYIISLGKVLYERPCTKLEGHFHVSMGRKVGFRSLAHQRSFLSKANAVVLRWRQQYPDGVALGTPVWGWGNSYLFLNRENVVEVFRPTLAPPQTREYPEDTAQDARLRQIINKEI